MQRIAILFVSLVFVTGCRQIEETDNPISGGLTEMGATSSPDRPSTSTELSRVQFDDVPVIDGFFLRNHRNETFSYRYGKGLRVGRFVYWGKADEETVIQRYLELMPKDPYNWSLSTPYSGGGTDSGSPQDWQPLQFAKPGSRCEIGVSREPNKEGLLVTIWVEST